MGLSLEPSGHPIVQRQSDANNFSSLRLSADAPVLGPDNSIIRRLEIEGGINDPAVQSMRKQALDNLNSVMRRVIEELKTDKRSVGEKIDAMYDIVLKEGFVVGEYKQPVPSDQLLVHNLANKHLDCDTYSSLVIGAAETLGWKDVNLVVLSDHAFVRWHKQNFDYGEISPDKYYVDAWGWSPERAELPGKTGVEAYAWLGRGIADGRSKRYQDSIRSYTRAIEIDPVMQQAHNNRAEIDLANGAVKRAVEGFERAVQIDPHYATPHLNLGDTYRWLGLMHDATEEYSRAIKINPTDSTYRDRALSRASEGDIEGSLEDLSKADKGNVERLIEDYSKVLKISPNNSSVLFRRAMLYMQKGQILEGLTDLFRPMLNF